MNALQQAQEWASRAAEMRDKYEKSGALSDLGEANGCMDLAAQYAAIAQAEAAERQATALEGIYRMLRYIAPAVEYQAAGDVSPEFKTGAAVEAMHADNVDSDPYDDGYNGPRADLFSGRDDDQRAEDEAGYNAGIAPGLHR